MILQISNNEQFERLLEGLAADILDAGYHLQLRNGLLKAVPEYQREVDQQRNFWQLTINAQTSAVLAHLCRAYDQQSDSLSLQSLIDTIRDNAHLFGNAANPRLPPVVNPDAARPDPTALQQDRLSVSPKDPLVARLVGLRGKFVVHRNAINTFDRLGDESRFAISFGDQEELWRRGLSLLNRYSQLFRHTSWVSSLSGQDDFKGVLLALRRDRER